MIITAGGRCASNAGHSVQPYNRGMLALQGPGSRSFPCLRLLFGEELMPGEGTDSLVTKSNGEVKKVLGRKSALSLDKESGKNHR